MSIIELEKEIQAANLAYSAGKPYMTDSQYDQLWQNLHQLDPSNKLLYHTANNPNLAASHRPHKAPIFGTQKAFRTEELKPFLLRFKDKELLLQPKYDGCAAVLYKQEDSQLTLLLEGDGLAGRDISHHLDQIELPKTFHSAESIELVIPLNRWNPEFGRNPRNVCAGWLARHELPEASVVQAVSHERGSLYETIEAVEDLPAFEELLLSLYNLWSKSYPIDGIMLKPLNESDRLIAGNNGTVSLWSIAWKPPIETAETIVRSIEWNISRSGRIIPTIIYDPLELCSTTNTRVTANNAQWLKDRAIAVGSRITVGKAGEIIPKILQILEPGTPKLPTYCPFCSTELLWSNKDLICTGSACLPQVCAQVAHFYSDKGMDLKTIGEKRIWELLKNIPYWQTALAYHPWMLLKESKEQTETLTEVWGSKRTQNFLDNLSEISGKRSKLHFFAGLGLPGLAYKSALKIEFFIKGSGNKKGISSKAINSFLEANVTLKEAKDLGLNFPFAETPELPRKFYCITGTLSVPRSDMEEYLSSKGWQMLNQVSGSTDYLIVGDLSRKTTKYNKATEQGVKIITEEELPELLKET